MITIHLSPSGNDAWSGRLAEPADGGADGPLATVFGAQQAVRRMLAQDPSQAVEILLRSGLYRLDHTLVLTPQDSGTGDQPVIWRNFPGETPVLSGGAVVRNWRKLEHPVAGLDETLRKHVWVADLPSDQDFPRRFSALFDEQGLLPRARSSPRHTTAGKELADHSTLHFAPGDLRSWPNLDDVEILLAPTYPWLVNYLPLAAVNEQQGTATTRIPGTYKLSTGSHGHSCEGSGFGQYWVENTLDGLREPGHWALDTHANRLYLWPRNGEPGDSILAPTLTELVRFEGDSRQSAWTHHIILDGLTFSHGDRMRWPEARIGVQHDWDLYNFPNAMVRLRDVEQITIQNCTFTDSGASALRLDLHATHNRVVANEMRDLGGGGISLIGYGPGTRDENHHNEIARNHIHHCGKLWWHSVGILLCQSGHNHVHNNLIHDMPYSGIVLVGGREGLFAPKRPDWNADGFGWVRWDEIDLPPMSPEQNFEERWPRLLRFLHTRDNLVEHNEIHHLMLVLGDGNGIYISGAGADNVIRRNFVRDIEGLGAHSAIRFDDCQWRSLVTENVVWRISGGGITLKHVNDVINNIVVDCKRYGSILVRRAPSVGANIHRNILVQSGRPLETPGAQPPFYYALGGGTRIEEPNINNNLLFCREEPTAAERCLGIMRTINKDLRSIIADPLFLDANKGDFRLSPKSPAFQIGFQPINSWGLTLPTGPAKTER